MDSTPATIDVLPAIVEEVRGEAFCVGKASNVVSMECLVTFGKEHELPQKSWELVDKLFSVGYNGVQLYP